MNPKILADLRGVLAMLYPDETSIKRIVTDAGIPLSAIAFSGSATNSWYAVLAEAEKLHKVPALLDAIATEYGANQNFVKASTAYHREAETVAQQLSQQPDAAPLLQPSVSASAVQTSAQYYSCFISFASQDQDFVERLYADLQRAGVPCWYAPEDLPIGGRIRQVIDASIHEYDKLLLVLSSHSVGSSWVEKEVETAFDTELKRKQQGHSDWVMLFPIRLDDAVMRTEEAWAADIRRMRNIGNFSQWKAEDIYQTRLQRLLRDLKKT